MFAYKFLGNRAVGLISGFEWPRNRWVVVDGPLVPTLNGIHGCNLDDLSYWIDSELWTVELAGETIDGDHAVVAARGRLVERIEAWNSEASRDFTEVCGERSRGLGPANAAAGWVPDAGAAYVAAHAAGLDAERSGESYESGFVAERHWQSQWLVKRLGLWMG
jgi:hypothetical protein